MRVVYTAFVLLMAAAVIVFCVQNLSNVAMSFLGWSISVPLPFLVVTVYILGMMTGGTAVAFIRRMIQGATSKPKQAP
jgi:lipopolysaccharide assembly protein A